MFTSSAQLIRNHGNSSSALPGAAPKLSIHIRLHIGTRFSPLCLNIFFFLSLLFFIDLWVGERVGAGGSGWRGEKRSVI